MQTVRCFLGEEFEWRFFGLKRRTIEMPGELVSGNALCLSCLPLRSRFSSCSAPSVSSFYAAFILINFIGFPLHFVYLYAGNFLMC